MSGPARTSTHVHRALAVAGVAGVMFAASQLTASAAPGDTSTGTVQANVGVSSAITLTGLTSAFTLNGLPNSTVTGSNAVSYAVNTNNVGGYTVTVQARTAALTPVGGTSTDSIPIENLRVRPDSTSAFTALSNTGAVTLRNKSTRSAATGDAYADDYQVTIPFVADATYRTVLDYIATAS